MFCEGAFCLSKCDEDLVQSLTECICRCIFMLALPTTGCERYYALSARTYVIHLLHMLHDVGADEKFSRSEVKGQGHGENKCTFAVEAYISMPWRRHSFVFFCANFYNFIMNTIYTG